jgi:hypothetical protein
MRHEFFFFYSVKKSRRGREGAELIEAGGGGAELIEMAYSLTLSRRRVALPSLNFGNF